MMFKPIPFLNVLWINQAELFLEQNFHIEISG